MGFNPLALIPGLNRVVKYIFPDKQETLNTEVADQESARIHDSGENVSTGVANFRALIRPVGGALVLFTHFFNIFLGWQATGFKRFTFTYEENLINFAIITFYFGFRHIEVIKGKRK